MQSEYFVPREHVVGALRAMAQLQAHLAAILVVSEVRTVAADDLWMSPFFGGPRGAIHFTWKHDWPSIRGALAIIEEALAPFHARPHWGKLFTIPAPQLQSLYENLPEFRELLRTYDPNGKFRNEFLNTYVFGGI